MAAWPLWSMSPNQMPRIFSSCRVQLSWITTSTFYSVCLFTGFLYSIERKYAFYFSGAAMVLSGLISFPLRKISHWERKKRGEISNSSTTSDDEMKQHQFIKPVELVGIWCHCFASKTSTLPPIIMSIDLNHMRLGYKISCWDFAMLLTCGIRQATCSGGLPVVAS